MKAQGGAPPERNKGRNRGLLRLVLLLSRVDKAKHHPGRDHACSHWHVGVVKELGGDGMLSTFESGAWKYMRR